jgi:hypothetical protein
MDIDPEIIDKLAGNLKNRPLMPSREQLELERQAGYDLEGYINKYGIPDRSKGQHLTDEFKLPNHITFSDGSIYHSEKTPGGQWRKVENKWHYKPSPYVLSIHPKEKLQKYFQEREPDSVLDLQ